MKFRINTAGWRLVVGIVATAAAGTLGWSLFAVGRHYGMPAAVAGATVAVFDGCSLACLKLASDASKAGRSAMGPRLATLLMAAASGYLNNWHAELIRGGIAASVLFIAPTVALLLISDMSWASARAAAREQRGEEAMRMPILGLAWLIAPKGSVRAVKKRAADHLQGLNTPPPRRSHHDVLAAEFADMDPGDAIRIVAGSHPGQQPGELAALLRTYGVNVDAVHVALVLGQRPPEVNLERDDGDTPDALTDAPRSDPMIGDRAGGGSAGDTPDAPADTPSSPMVAEMTAAEAIAAAAAVLGEAAAPVDIARHVKARHGLEVDPAYVRTVRSRLRRRQPQAQERMTDGYL